MELNWDAIGAVGEILGAAAVFITLIYLAHQVRHARSEARRALGQARAEANRDLIKMGLEPDVLSANVKADLAVAGEPSPPLAMLMARAGLDEREATRVLMVYIAYWNYVVHMVPLVDDLSAGERQLFDEFVANRYGRPGVYNELFKSRTLANEKGSAAIDYVTAILEQHGPD